MHQFFSFGLNDFQQLSFGEDKGTNLITPHKQDLSNPCVKISLSLAYSIVTFENGKANFCGCPSYLKRDHNSKLIFGHLNVTDVASGRSHVVGATSDGSVITAGWNRFGECGTEEYEEPIFIESPIVFNPIHHFGGRRVVQCAAGESHSLLRTDDGVVFGFGKNDLGQLGLGHNINQFTPVVIPLDSKISNISCGLAHSFAISVTGDVFAWGWNGYSQLGVGDTEDHAKPILVEEFRDIDIKIRKITCGGWHSVCLSDDGRVFSWGWGEFGQLGHGDQKAQSYPHLIEYFVKNHITIRDIACGSRHTVALSDDGKLFSFGLATFGRLGLGNITDKIVSMPTSVQLIDNDEKVFCPSSVFSGPCSWGTVVLCESSSS